MRVLIAEDDVDLAHAIQQWFGHVGLVADVVSDGDLVLDAVARHPFDVVVLDRGLPGTLGDEICWTLAQRDERPGILMLTSASRTADKVRGLQLGADDYLAKPFELPELVARVRAIARRPRAARPVTYAVGDLRFDPARREVRRGDRAIALTPRELAVLEALLEAQGAVLPTPVLLAKAWSSDANALAHSVKVTISSLRRKLGEPEVVRTAGRSGYVIDVDRHETVA